MITDSQSFVKKTNKDIKYSKYHLKYSTIIFWDVIIPGKKVMFDLCYLCESDYKIICAYSPEMQKYCSLAVG